MDANTCQFSTHQPSTFKDAHPSEIFAFFFNPLLLPSQPIPFGRNKPNWTRSFQNTTVIETSLFDFHNMEITVMKICYKKQKSRTIHYSSYKNFWVESFKPDLNNELLIIDINIQISSFNKIFLFVIEKLLPKKLKLCLRN